MNVDLLGLQFSQPSWLLGLLIPLVFWPLVFWGLRRARWERAERARLERYADPHLLPHLVVSGPSRPGSRRGYTLWSLLWALGMVAMAGPRWGYTDVALYRPGANLVILLDLSRSMAVADVKPSRLARAGQEIEDLLHRRSNLAVGLIGFASVAYVISPITEDFDTVRHVLPAVSTDLVRWQGSRPSAAFDRAQRLLKGQPQENARALLLISDGDFVEPGLEDYAALLNRSGIRLYVLGVGTPKGGNVPAPDGGWLHGPDGEVITSRLEEARLKALAAAGGGSYWKADYRDRDVLALLRRLSDVDQPQTGAMTQRIWNEHFWLPVGLMLLLLLQWFRTRRSDDV